MNTTSKVLMILGGLLVGAAGTSYMMLLQADHRAAAEARAGMDDALQSPGTDSRVSENQVTGGSIDSSHVSGAITKGAPIAQQPAAHAPAPEPAPVPAPAPAKIAPESTPPAAQAMTAPQPAAPQPAAPTTQAMVEPQPTAPAAQMTAPPPPPAPATQAMTAPQPAAPPAQALVAPQPAAPAARVAPAPKPAAQPKQAPSTSTAVASVNPRDSSRVKVAPAPRAERGRDDLDRRVMILQGATPETDQLVRDSAKLDPSLPPPNVSALRQSTEAPAPYQSNPSGATSTNQLVRDSSKVDPALPPPDMTAVRATMNRAAMMDQPGSSKPGVGSNPVAAAMTDQLVRDSAKLDPSLPPPK